MPRILPALILVPALFSGGQTVADERPEKSASPDELQILRDLPYADNENPRQRLDLFLPEKRLAAERPRPLLVWIHGGAWRTGHRQGGLRQIREFIASGEYAGASIGYRLTQEANWPAQAHDVKAAIRWLRGNAKKYGYDPDRIAAWGASAGGHLVNILGATGGVKELEGKLGKHLDQSSRVSCVVNYYGPTDLLRMNDVPGAMDHDAPDSPESRLVGGPIQEHRDRANAASPIRHLTKDDAPVLTVHGTKDPLVIYDQGKRYHEACLEAGVKSELLPIEGGGHGGRGFRTRETLARVRAFLEKHLKAKP